jgi:hypothetical protein
LHVSISRRERRREGERDTVKGRMIKRLLRTASVLRYSTRTKHYKLNRIWAFGIRKIIIGFKEDFFLCKHVDRN